MISKKKLIALWVFALSLIAVGVMHFVRSDWFVAIMPPYIPYHLAMVYISGVAEIVGGVGLLLERTRRLAAWGVIALLIAVFPANIHMAMNHVVPPGMEVSPTALYLRLLFQPLMIWLVWWTALSDR